MAVTRLGGYGGPRMPFGSFAGKTEVEPDAAPSAEGIEWTLPASRMHFAISADLPHWTMPSEGSS